MGTRRRKNEAKAFFQGDCGQRKVQSWAHHEECMDQGRGVEESGGQEQGEGKD